MALAPCCRWLSGSPLTFLAAILLPLAAVSADTIWHKSPGARQALMYENVKIEKVEGDSLVFISASGNETRKKLAEISRIAMDDEPALSAAETAFDAGNFAGSIDGYRKAAQASSRDWVRKRSALRLIDAGKLVPDFAASVAGFAYLATIDADAALQAKPAIPPDAPKVLLSAAADQVSEAEGISGITPDQDRVLLNFRVELLTAAHDTDGAAAALKELDKLGGSAPPGSGPGANTPADAAAINRARAEQTLNEARVALAQKDYGRVQAAISGGQAAIVDPMQQDEALFILAQSKEASAGTDPTALTDAGVAYMRVVANFRNVQGAPHIAESLMKTAAIEEKLAKPEEALRIYQSVASDYKETPYAHDATDDAARITAALKPKG
jgi:TolA-binding protein